MGDTDGKALAGLQSVKSVQRLEQISTLRTRGIGENIDLPQLVVCGDQSAGKSSVLEGITGIPFPREEGVCTKFATEVILEHAEGQSAILATIIPHASRSEQMKTALQAFNTTIKGFEELPEVIAKAGALMGIRGYGDNVNGPAFVEDVLRIKMTGPSGLHLSIVDLPGLIANASEDQTEADVQTVHQMVDSYAAKPRTIILAVVQAGNDIANQSIIRKSKNFDKAGQRTVGIITKPDLLNEGAQASIAALAKNQGTTRLKLGFFLLKNPTPKEREVEITAEARSADELRFFLKASPWKEQKLDPRRVGIDRLKSYLQTLLDRHIESELPKVREEIKALARSTEEEIVALPVERPTAGHLRMFLSDLAMKYYGIATAGLNGDYHTSYVAFFKNEGAVSHSTRLRATVHMFNTDFSDHMRDYGARLQVGPPLEARNGEGEDDNYENSVSSVNEYLYDAVEDLPQIVGKKEMNEWVKKVYLATRGRELPGSYNHVLLTELYHQQSELWEHISTVHLDRVHGRIVSFVKKAIAHLRMEPDVVGEIEEGIDARLQERKDAAAEELEKLFEDERQQLITYNHYYTDNVQKSRQDATEKIIQQAMDKTPENVDKAGFGLGIDGNSLIATVRANITANMDDQACAEALTNLNAYYKVARKTFVDNVCKQVIERHLLRGLQDIFSPQLVAMYTDEDLQRIAGEKPEAVEKRKQLQEQLANLKAALLDLRK